jgi:hypothetical protein
MIFDKIRIFLISLAIFLSLAPVFAQISVTFRVEVPSIPDSSQIFITGNQSEPGNWNPSLRLLENEMNNVRKQKKPFEVEDIRAFSKFETVE